MIHAISKFVDHIPRYYIVEDTTPRPAYENERWLYGYHLKVRHIRQLAQKYGLPWNEDPIRCIFRVRDIIIYSFNFDFGWKAAYYRGRSAHIITFLEDDGRKRLEMNRFSKKEMNEVRRIIGLPKGTKPKWYNSVDKYDEGTEFSSEDEAFPEVGDWLNRPAIVHMPTENDEDEDEEDDASARESESGGSSMDDDDENSEGDGLEGEK